MDFQRPAFVPVLWALCSPNSPLIRGPFKGPPLGVCLTWRLWSLTWLYLAPPCPVSSLFGGRQVGIHKHWQVSSSWFFSCAHYFHSITIICNHLFFQSQELASTFLSKRPTSKTSTHAKMQFSSLALALLSLSFATALPLNINLGAYSPAIVVGDGALSFGVGEATAAETIANAQAPNTGAATAEGGAAPATGTTINPPAQG